MSDEHEFESEDGERRFLSKDEFDQMWGDARAAAGLPVDPYASKEPSKEYFIHPILILYTGMALGPFATAIVALATVRGRVQIRFAVVILAAAALTWLMVQGVTAMNAQVWSAFALQFSRSALNFLNGVVAYVVIKKSVEDYGSKRNTVHRTLATIIVMVSAAWVLNTSLLLAIGR